MASQEVIYSQFLQHSTILKQVFKYNKTKCIFSFYAVYSKKSYVGQQVRTDYFYWLNPQDHIVIGGLSAANIRFG